MSRLLLLVAPGAVVLLLLFGELALRLIALPETLQQTTFARDTANPGLYRLDDLAGYVMVPNYHGRLHGADFDQSFETNSQGLRGSDVAAKPPGEFRVVVVGDSFVMGAEVPVEQRFSDRLQALLQERGYTNVHVVNVGVRGWATYNEAGYLQENVAWLQPDLVVLCIFLGNNIGENVFATAAGYELKGGGIGYGPPAQALEGNSVAWFDHNFRVGAAEYSQPRLDANDWNPADGLPKPHRNPATPGADAGGSEAGDRTSGYVPTSMVDAARTWLHSGSILYRGLADSWFRVRYGYPHPDPLLLDNWLVYALRAAPHQYWYQLALPLTAHYVDQARIAAARMGAESVVVLIPPDALVDDAKLAAQLDRYRLSAADVDLDTPGRELTAAVAHLDIPLIDLGPGLRARPDRFGLFFPHDIHFTSLGHEVAAEALADWSPLLLRLPRR